MGINISKDINFRNKAVRNMWIIIFTVIFVVNYSAIYSLVLFIWANKYCYISDHKSVVSINNFLERFIHYFIWVYPLLYILWPADALCSKRKKKIK